MLACLGLETALAAPTHHCRCCRAPKSEQLVAATFDASQAFELCARDDVAAGCTEACARFITTFDTDTLSVSRSRPLTAVPGRVELR